MDLSCPVLTELRGSTGIVSAWDSINVVCFFVEPSQVEDTDVTEECNAYLQEVLWGATKAFGGQSLWNHCRMSFVRGPYFDVAIGPPFLIDGLSTKMMYFGCLQLE